MRKTLGLPAAVVFFFCAVSFFAPARTAGEEITGRGGYGTIDLDPKKTGKKANVHNEQWLFLGIRLGPSLRFYTPSGDTAFTGGDAIGPSLEAGVQADLRIVPLLGIQVEAVFTWDNASIWQYALNDAGNDLDRYTRYFEGMSLHFPLTAKLNFYPPGEFRISPFFGGYFVLPLGKMKTGSPRDEEESFSYSLSLPVGLTGGVSIAYPLGPCIIFVDLRYAADLGEPDLDGSGLETYRRHGVSLSLGLEFGLLKRQGGSSK
ncbi:MAG: PorT family protein [Treponema sp.]|jgi:hypothetical protein|nr:PorT family protein [Treponema sp.]